MIPMIAWLFRFRTRPDAAQRIEWHRESDLDTSSRVGWRTTIAAPTAADAIAIFRAIHSAHALLEEIKVIDSWGKPQ